MDKIHGVFVRHIEKSGWPISGRLSNADVFDKLVAPKLLESGRRVAYLLIDAMRYELGVELAKHLNEAGQIDVQMACAQMPTVTPVGMATLLPGAGQNLKITNKDNQLLVVFGDQPLATVAQRRDVLRKKVWAAFCRKDWSVCP